MDKEELKEILESLETMAVKYYADTDPHKHGLCDGMLIAVSLIRLGILQHEEVAK